MAKRVFITGGTGCAGQLLIRMLAEAGYTVRVFTRDPKRLTWYHNYKNIEYTQGEYSDYETLEAGLKGCDAIIHMGLQVGHNPTEMVDTEIRGMAFILEAAVRQGVERFIYTSTCATMFKRGQDRDEESFQMPMGIYGAGKAANEKILLGFDEYWDGEKYVPVTMKRNIVRLTNVYSVPIAEGAPKMGDRRYHEYAMKIVKGEDIDRISHVGEEDGEQFVSGRLLAKLYMALLESDINKEVFFNVGMRYITWGELLERMKSFVPDSASRINYVPYDQEHVIYRPRKMERIFGIRFDGDEDLDEFLQYEINEAKMELGLL